MKRKKLSAKIFGWITIIAFTITILVAICSFAFLIMGAIMYRQKVQGVEQLFYALKILGNIFIISFILWSISSIGFRLSIK